MTWQQRLRALVLAGGALAAVGCGDDVAVHGGTDMAVSGDMTYTFGCANGNPDPCCFHPDMKGCPSDGGAPGDGGGHD